MPLFLLLFLLVLVQERDTPSSVQGILSSGVHFWGQGSTPGARRTIGDAGM